MSNVDIGSAAKSALVKHLTELLKDKTASELALDQEYPTSSDAALYNSLTGDGVHITDDGCLEIRAGDAVILLDGTTGQITLDGKAIATNSGTLNMHTKVGGLNVGYKPLNPTWVGTDLPGQEVADALTVLERSPLVTNPAALATTILTVVPGVPTPVPVPFAKLVTPVPLFMPSTQTMAMAHALEELMKELV